MPTRLSKFSIEATCQEYSHPWTSSCVKSVAGMGLAAVQDSFKIYTMLYLVTLLMKKGIPTKKDLKKTFNNIIQSTLFLSWSALSYSMFLCLIRRITGGFNIFTVSFVPAFFSSFTAILLETPFRRPLLCLYVSNIATETLFRMAVSRGYASIIPKGEVLIFAAGMTTLLYLYRKKENQDSIFKLARIILGPHEENGYKPKYEFETLKPTSSCGRTEYNQRKKSSNIIFNLIYKALKLYKILISRIKTAGGKHPECPHPNSCLHYVASGALKTFSLGLAFQVVLKSVFQLKTLILIPSKFKSMIFKKEILNLPFFLGGFVGLYKMVSCFLRRVYNKDSPKFAIPASLIASTTFVMYSDNSIALYLVWKAAQLLWNDGVERGKLPEVKWFVIFLYCFSTSVLFHSAFVEPQNLRISYWKFLYNLSGGRLAAMSRIPIDQFGLETSKQMQEVMKISHTHNRHTFRF